MRSARPVVLGYDAVSPLGTVFGDQWNRAAGGHSGIGPLTRFPLRENFPVQAAGEVADVDITPYPFLRPREMVHWRSPIFKYGMLVVHRTLKKDRCGHYQRAIPENSNHIQYGHRRP